MSTARLFSSFSFYLYDDCYIAILDLRRVHIMCVYFHYVQYWAMTNKSIRIYAHSIIFNWIIVFNNIYSIIRVYAYSIYFFSLRWPTTSCTDQHVLHVPPLQCIRIGVLRTSASMGNDVWTFYNCECIEIC